MVAHETHHGAEEHPPSSIRSYVMTGLILTVITIVELFLSYSALPHGLMVALLIGLSAVKFVIVVAIFMHLKFEDRLLTRLFLFGLILAASIMLALLALFWNDSTDIVGGIPEGQQQSAPAGH
jgi:cytochrome c oxidase subunit IV